MRTPAFAVILVLAAFQSAASTAQPPAIESGAGSCLVGSYDMADGSTLDIGPGAGDAFRWRRPDGQTSALARQRDGSWRSTLGWTDRPDGHELSVENCESGAIRFDGVAGQRQPLVQVDTRFQGSGVMLRGRLTLPPGQARVPLVVLVHGAERSSALESYSLQRELASQGIGVFAYDKRGTGKSEGRYTQDYLTLATDAIHALHEARRLAGKRAGRIGYQGGSQGGWVAPLAARIEPVDFVIVSFGLAVSPIEEDREAIAFDISRAGFGPDVQRKARTVADASAAIISSNFTEGFDRLDALKQEHGQAPWFRFVRGNFTSYLLTTPEADARRDFPALLEGIPAHYDPMPVLANLDVPQLWILGGQDRDAPPFETLHRLQELQHAGRPVVTAVFPLADHGMYEFETRPDGERISTRQPQGYLEMMADFIKNGRIATRYGNATLSPGPR
ncbi:alpha/beta hydrolase family protein [Stenotrophomonas tumulicola]|uniref:Alpha/beta fold hydrolase n=1 Tax=Stenotrophomonas tumulicola TaxID=1685415 RepID=A0A7W3FME9_9GAMM|nr:alpha/beta fold hydrolase [Stenotrophomonas tumulicola]MBA8682256.1 alpha/beta fold hydrolase [Stenotrophomonas tumulicola]